MIRQKISFAADLVTAGAYKEAVAQLVPTRVFAAIFNIRFATDTML